MNKFVIIPLHVEAADASMEETGTGLLEREQRLALESNLNETSSECSLTEK